ncbi:hydroxymethylbilane synthase [Halovulum sp. GXIMD14793]
MTHPTPKNPLRIGTRGSPLALAQAEETRQRLMDAHGLPTEAFKIVVIKTTADRVLDRSLSEIGGKGLFTKELEEALLTDQIDIAVHSTKDVPVEQPLGLSVDCALPREDVRDAFVSLKYASIDDLPEGAVVGTSSLRRRAQLLHKRPDLQTVAFRGNVQTRLQKLQDGVAEATFLAMAGIRRLGLDLPATPIPADRMLPAVAQGAICIERRTEDTTTATLLHPLHDAETWTRISAERSLLRGLDGSCQTPIGGLAEMLDGNRLRLRGEIIRPDGSEALTAEQTGPAETAVKMGAAMAEDLLGRAGRDFLTV